MKKKITETTSFKECMALLPYYIGALVLLGIVSVILMISGIGDYTLLTGAVAGTAVSALNFVLMCGKSDNSDREIRKARYERQLRSKVYRHVYNSRRADVL